MGSVLALPKSEGDLATMEILEGFAARSGARLICGPFMLTKGPQTTLRGSFLGYPGFGLLAELRMFFNMR